MAAGDVANGTINLNGNCIYTLTSATDSLNGGTGRIINNATTLNGNGAIIQRDPNAATFRLLRTNSNITIRNVTLRNGKVTHNGAGLRAAGNTTLINVRFENNATVHTAGATTVNVGGAIYASANLTVDSSFFLGNQSEGSAGAIYFAGVTGSIRNSIFASNTSGGVGAALVANLATGNLTFVNNTFTDAFKNPKEALSLSGSATVQNNIFHNFKTGLTATGGTAVSVNEDYNLFAANDIDPQSVNSTVITRGGHSRIAASPRFVDPTTANYRLQASSPAIDLGVAVNLPTDADGLARPFTGTGVDIGAYEYQGVGTPAMSIVKTGPPYIGSDGNVRFALTVINESASTLSDLRIVEQLPAGATYVANSASDGGSFASGVLTWNLAPLAPNQSKRVEYKVTTAQALVSNNYNVSSIGNPAITATGAALTTPYDATAVASGFFPFSDGFSFPNYGDVITATDVTAADMVTIYGTGVCKTQNPCVLSAAAESVRVVKATDSTGGHCAGMAAASLAIFDRLDVNPGDFQSGAILTYDLTKPNTRRLISLYMSTQGDNPASTAGLPATRNIVGAKAIVDALRANLATPNPSDRYALSLYDVNGGSGHRVTPYAVRQIDANTYWIYTYDNNYPNNFDRVFKVTYSTGAWLYEGGATNPTAPPSDYRDDGTHPDHLILRSFRWIDRFPKVCSTSAGGACAPAVAQVAAASIEAAGDVYDFQLDGEGYIMVTRSDGLRAGVDPATGVFISEIPGSESVAADTGLGLHIPNIIRIPHTPGLTYSVRVADAPTLYGNAKAVANLNIIGPGFVTRLKGLQLDSSADLAVQPGNNDVVGITFDADNKRLVFQASTLDSNTPSLGMAISQANPLPDYTFEVGGAQMAPGKALTVAFNQATGQLVISNNDPANNTYTLNVERLNQDGTKTAYQSNTVSDGTGVGANVNLGPSWTGGAPPITQNNGPTAVNDSYVTTVNTALTVAAPGVLSNDTAPYASKLTASLVTGPARGTLAFNVNGSFTYTPAPNYVGADSFTYKVSDGVLTSTVATVNLAVNGVVTNQIQQISFKTTSSTTTPDPTYPAQSPKGVTVLTLVAKNTGVPLRNVSFRVVKLTQNNYLLNADGGPGQVGSKLSVANSTLPGGNQLWDRNEQVAQAFRIGLMSRSAFIVQLDVYATKSLVAAADQENSNEADEFIDTITLEINPETWAAPGTVLYLPAVSNQP